MRVSEIYDILDTISPFEFQEKWDNSGLLIGSFEDSFDAVFVCLDLSLELLEDIPNNSLIISHHPIIFAPFNRLNFNDLSSKLIQQIIKKDIQIISLHSNFDKSHLNNYVMSEVLEFEDIDCDGFVCKSKFSGNIDELYNHLSSKLNLSSKKITKSSDIDSKNSIKIGFCTGSGMSLLKHLDSSEIECFLTGDIKYHDANEAIAKGISLIDIGHFESEIHFETIMIELLQKEILKTNYKDMQIKPLGSICPFNN
jgi:dinuclear metal center YbgI/SA1388 family protein